MIHSPALHSCVMVSPSISPPRMSLGIITEPRPQTDVRIVGCLICWQRAKRGPGNANHPTREPFGQVHRCNQVMGGCPLPARAHPRDNSLNAALANLAMHARVVVCGAIAQYNEREAPPGSSNYWRLLVNRATMTGFLVFDYLSEHATARRRLAEWVRSGQIHAPDTVVPGSLDDFQDIFSRLFTGASVGKLVLDISDRP